MAQAELTDVQREAVAAFGAACVAMSEAMNGLGAADIDVTTALQSIPTGEGRTMYDELPGTLKMML